MDYTPSRSASLVGPSPAPLATWTANAGPREADARTLERNQFLARLSDATRERLLPFLELVTLDARDVLWEPDVAITRAYFPRSCVCSLVKPIVGELPVETVTVGCEGMLGISIALGVMTPVTRAVVQIGGEALSMPADALRTQLEREAELRGLALLHAQALLDQCGHGVACNRRHDIDARCARWLLATADRVGSDHFLLTHDFLAQMLGVRRASVTVAVGRLQATGCIRYSRGHMTVRDRAALVAASCGCDESLRTEREQLFARYTAG